MNKCSCKKGDIDCSPQADIERTGIIPEEEAEPMQQSFNNGGNWSNTQTRNPGVGRPSPVGVCFRLYQKLKGTFGLVSPH